MAKETSKGHKKHADIPRPTLGKYGRRELGLLGAPCGVIQRLVDQLAEYLKDKMSITYLDADHAESPLPSYGRMTDHISHDSKVFEQKQNDFDRRIAFADSDLLLVNSNHFLSDHQIVFCTEAKKDSLHRKLDRLTDVKLILLDQDIERPHDFLTDHIKGRSVPVLKIDDIAEISKWVSDHYQGSIPKVKGLVLVGGKSQRMGTPKERLNYHGQPQVEYAKKIFMEAGVPAYLSCRDQAQADVYPDDKIVKDTFEGLGPFGGLLSAFRSDPDSAWYVIACDQPLLSASDIARLLAERDTSKVATCYHNPETGFPEPLITIWEPRAYPRLLSFLSMGYSCPRKVLINSNIQEVVVEDTTFMKNANTPAEMEDLKSRL